MSKIQYIVFYILGYLLALELCFSQIEDKKLSMIVFALSVDLVAFLTNLGYYLMNKNKGENNETSE